MIDVGDLIGKLDADGAASSNSRPKLKIPPVRPLARRQVLQVLTWAAPSVDLVQCAVERAAQDSIKVFDGPELRSVQFHWCVAEIGRHCFTVSAR